MEILEKFQIWKYLNVWKYFLWNFRDLKNRPNPDSLAKWFAYCIGKFIKICVNFCQKSTHSKHQARLLSFLHLLVCYENAKVFYKKSQYSLSTKWQVRWSRNLMLSGPSQINSGLFGKLEHLNWKNKMPCCQFWIYIFKTKRIYIINAGSHKANSINTA